MSRRHVILRNKIQRLLDNYVKRHKRVPEIEILGYYVRPIRCEEVLK